jgi:phosphoribosylanthranilate isomerase
MRTRIKVCGITDPAEAQAIAALGVDALGFIFVAASPRCVTPVQVRDIVATLPPFVHAVGVFMGQEQAWVEEVSHSCGLSMVQLHGQEPPAYCRAISLPVLKAFRVRPEALPDLAAYGQSVKGFLLDTYRSGQAGGTGATFDWGVVDQLALPGPLLLAGGLTPENVGHAIRQTRPFAVDVNSGVELSPGRKDLEAVRRLVLEVRQTDMLLATER